MQNVYLFEINDIIANQMKLPYSTGLIWSYCILDEAITNNYKLDGWFYYRQDMDDIVDQIDNPSVIGFSCFVWNWKFNRDISKKIKEKWPDCRIVFGGWYPPIQDRSQGFFEDNPYVDMIVHGEGEFTFKDILLENLKPKEEQDWTSVAGCSVPLEDLSTFVTPSRDRIPDINGMPTPYLNGLFDEIAKDCPYVLEATLETTRGCPYQCTFCEIGTKYYQRIKWQDLEKVFKEIDWMADNKVAFVYNADSNFGLIPNHLEVTKYFVKKKKETGYPDKHRCDWAKNKADKVLELAKLFTESGMDKGITVAIQSRNPDTLKAVRRKNLDDGKLGEFLKMYNDADVPAYVELILGLPEETLDSFIDGIADVIELDQHNYIGIYAMTALPNTPFGMQSYIDEYELEIISTFQAFNHYDITEDNDLEREKMVVGHKKMTFEDYKNMHYFRWVVMHGHYLGLTQFISRFLRSEYDISYKKFYKSFLRYCYDNPDSFLGNELKETTTNLEGSLGATQPWGRIINEVRENFGWDFEEATAINVCLHKETYYLEILDFMKKYLDVKMDQDVLDDLFEYQKVGILDPTISYPVRRPFKYNIHDVVTKKAKLKKHDHEIEFNAKNYDGDLYEWGKETLWWGRRVGACKTKRIEVSKDHQTTDVLNPLSGFKR